MDITPVIPQGKKVITAYGHNSFSINEERIIGQNIIVTPNKVQAWHITNIDELKDAEKFTEILTSEIKPEILLIGSGDNHIFLTDQIITLFRQNNIKVDTMQTGAACRTYNILLAEGREVVAALLRI